MTEPEDKDKPKVQSDHNSIAVGGINIGGDVSGNITIGNTGFTSDEVSVLITQIKSTFQPKPFDGRCPYKGLDVFEEEDAELFFGREKLVDDLVSRVKDSRTVFVTGPSGSGKSSLVRAGLIHALKQGAIKNSERWLYATMKPGRDPIGELGRVASSLAGSTNAEDEILAKAMRDETIFARWCEIALKEGRDKRLVLFIDQFEEVFTQINNETERVGFLNLLTHAATVENRRVIILFSMRSDFVSNCATYTELNALLNQQFIQIGAMQPHELVSAMAQPALRVGLRIDPDLIAQVINDMKGEPGALPLMQFALKELFDAGQAKGGVIALTLSDYLKHGGIDEALERHADASLAKLSEPEQQLARSIFSGLIEIGRGTQDTRRTALFDELVPANSNAEDVEVMVQKLADARLITTDEQAGKDTVTISHEKLIDAWPWLKRLVNENRDVIAVQNEISADAKEWDDHKRDASYLYSGGRLTNVREQLDMGKLDLSGTAHKFIEAGKARQKKNKTILVSGISTIITLLVLAIIMFSRQATINAQTANTAQAASTYAIAQQATAQSNAEEAQKQQKLARAGELSAQSVALRENKFQLSLLLSIEAYHGLITVQSQGALLDNVQAHRQLRTYLNGHSDGVTSVAFSPDGKTLASGGYDETILLWDVGTGKPIGQPLTGHSGVVTSVAFSPDGKTLASGSRDETILLWDVATGKPIGQPLTGHSSWVLSVAFSPDGKTLASSSTGDIVLWNVATGKPIGQPLIGHTSGATSVAFSPDGKTLASGGYDETILLWDVGTGKPIGQALTGHSDSVISVAFSPDGKTLASGSYNHNILLWDVTTGKAIGQPLTRHNHGVYSVAFSPDGKTLASGAYDHTILLWDVATGKPIGQPLTGHSDGVASVAFSPDGKTLASGGYDGATLLWDLATGTPIGQTLTGHNDFVSSVAFSPDSKTLASGSADETILLWDVATGTSISQPLTGHNSSVRSVAFSPNGKMLASGGYDGDTLLWDVATGTPIGQPLTRRTASINSLAFSPNGNMLASGSDDNTIILWNVATGKPIGQPLIGHTSGVTSAVFSPDGKTLASGSIDNTIILWDVATGTSISQPLTGHNDFVTNIAFNADGKTLASGINDNTIILWDVTTGKLIAPPLIGHTSGVTSAAFSPDGKTLASGSIDNTIILWDVATGRPIGQPLTGHSEFVFSVAFSPNGKTLASGGYEIILWDLDPESWVEKSCRRSNRNFTSAEWEQYFPGEDYRRTCEEWPLEPEFVVTPTAQP